MKQILKSLLLLCILVVFFTCIPILVHAQINPGCDPQDPLCPIDGGLTLLIATGVGYGIKKAYYDRRKPISIPKL